MTESGDAGAVAVDSRLLRRWALPATDEAADKNTRGGVLIVAGGVETPGAALLAAGAALRSGAGKVTIAAPKAIAVGLGFYLPETRVVGLPQTRSGGLASSAAKTVVGLMSEADSVAVGPGMSPERSAVAVARAVADSLEQRLLLLDAAAISAARFRRFKVPPLLTPHAGEMAHLLGCDKSEVDARPEEFALALAERANAVVVLKGPRTYIVSPEGRSWGHDGKGLVGLAASGSGDVLAGLIAGLAARCGDVAQAAVWGVFLHADAARRLAVRHGRIGYSPSDLLPELSVAMKRYE